MAENLQVGTTFKVFIVTPTSSSGFEDVVSASLDTVDGQVGILANHIKMIFSLQEGQIKILGALKEEVFTISDGFAEFSNNVLNVVVEECKSSRLG